MHNYPAYNKREDENEQRPSSLFVLGQILVLLNEALIVSPPTPHILEH